MQSRAPEELLRQAVIAAQSVKVGNSDIPRGRRSPLSDLLVARLFENHRDHAPVSLLKRLLPVPLKQKTKKRKKQKAEKPAESNVIPVTPPIVRPYIVLHSYPEMADILAEVCEFYRVKKIDIFSRRRTADIVYPRQIAMALCRELTLHSFPSISRYFGDRDHTTALHAARRIEKRAEINERVADELTLLRMRITERVAQRNNLVAVA